MSRAGVKQVHKSWSDSEIGYLVENIDVNASILAVELGRTSSGIRKAKMAIRRGDGIGTNGHFWTAEDDDFIRNTTQMAGMEVAKELGVTHLALKNRMHKLGVVRGKFTRNICDMVGRPLLAQTCIRCGLLLGREFFMIHPRKGRIPPGWTSSCRPCQQAAKRAKWTGRSPVEKVRAKQMTARLQAYTLDRASRRGHPYVSNDWQVLSDPDISMFGKALRLHRTYSGIVSMCSREGFTSKPGDPQDGQWLISFPESETG